MFRKIVG